VSIYLKACPECASTLPNQATHCPCGYDFATEKTEDHATLEQIAREERLYEDYLRARAEQAAHAAEAAAGAAARDPGDMSKAEAAGAGRREAEAARAQLMAQRARRARFVKLAARRGRPGLPQRVLREAG
jgi:hypothetical protein